MRLVEPLLLPHWYEGWLVVPCCFVQKVLLSVYFVVGGVLAGKMKSGKCKRGVR
jgi:hypothetical protein